MISLVHVLGESNGPGGPLYRSCDVVPGHRKIRDPVDEIPSNLASGYKISLTVKERRTGSVLAFRGYPSTPVGGGGRMRPVGIVLPGGWLRGKPPHNRLLYGDSVLAAVRARCLAAGSGALA